MHFVGMKKKPGIKAWQIPRHEKLDAISGINDLYSGQDQRRYGPDAADERTLEILFLYSSKHFTQPRVKR